MDFPSGENRAKTSAPGGSATGCAVPPFLSTVHNPFAYEKTMRLWLMSGYRNMVALGGASWEF